jgi:hypothetical protein
VRQSERRPGSPSPGPPGVQLVNARRQDKRRIQPDNKALSSGAVRCAIGNQNVNRVQSLGTLLHASAIGFHHPHRRAASVRF